MNFALLHSLCDRNLYSQYVNITYPWRRPFFSIKAKRCWNLLLPRTYSHPAVHVTHHSGFFTNYCWLKTEIHHLIRNLLKRSNQVEVPTRDLVVIQPAFVGQLFWGLWRRLEIGLLLVFWFNNNTEVNDSKPYLIFAKFELVPKLNFQNPAVKWSSPVDNKHKSLIENDLISFANVLLQQSLKVLIRKSNSHIGINCCHHTIVACDETVSQGYPQHTDRRLSLWKWPRIHHLAAFYATHSNLFNNKISWILPIFYL